MMMMMIERSIMHQLPSKIGYITRTAGNFHRNFKIAQPASSPFRWKCGICIMLPLDTIFNINILTRTTH